MPAASRTWPRCSGSPPQRTPLHPPTAGAAQSGSGSPATESLQSLLELRMLRVFREVHDPDTKRILIELAEQIVKRQNSPPQAG